MSLALVSDIHGNDLALGWPVILGNADDFLLEVPIDPPEPITARHLEKRDWTLAELEPRRSGRSLGHGWPRVIGGALYVNPGSVGVSDDGLAQFAILTGASVSVGRVAWNGS